MIKFWSNLFGVMFSLILLVTSAHCGADLVGQEYIFYPSQPSLVKVHKKILTIKARKIITGLLVISIVRYDDQDYLLLESLLPDYTKTSAWLIEYSYGLTTDDVVNYIFTCNKEHYIEIENDQNQVGLIDINEKKVKWADSFHEKVCDSENLYP